MMDLKVDEEEVDSGQPVSIQAFASSSTLHGISHIFSYERLSLKRVVWALCFMGSLALLALVCTNRIQYYFLYPHVTKLDEVAATRLTFPAVTFCNLNEFRFSRVTKNDLYHAGELLALLNNRYEIPDTQTADEKQLEILQDKANFRNFKPKPFNMLEFYDRAGHDIREMLLSCFFRGEQCSPEDFKVALGIESSSVVWLLNGGEEAGAGSGPSPRVPPPALMLGAPQCFLHQSIPRDPPAASLYPPLGSKHPPSPSALSGRSKIDVQLVYYYCLDYSLQAGLDDLMDLIRKKKKKKKN